MAPDSLTAEQRVVALLRTLAEARVSYGLGSTGEGVRMMPSVWHEGSYQELEEQLRRMRESPDRPLWWHVSYRYRFGITTTTILPVVRRRKGPEFILPANAELLAGGPSVGDKQAVASIYIWRPDVDMGMVDRGVTVLAHRMRHHELPDYLFRRLLNLPEKVAV